LKTSGNGWRRYRILKIPNKKALLFLACFLIVFAGTGWVVFKNLASWLIVSDPLPQSLDVIFTFGGEDSRIAYSKSLFSKNPRALWIISYENRKLLQTLGKEGFDTSRIRIVDTCTSTFAEISFLKNQMADFVKTRGNSGKVGLPTIGLVSNWYHMRRIKLTASRAIPKDLCKLKYFSVPLTKNESSRFLGAWWKDNNVRSIVCSEWWKILYYQVR
jgi:uncharacterized SAM-binding protein YcdF (DUF218 family)